MDDFHQSGPELGNQYDDDGLLQDYLSWRLPPEAGRVIVPGLRELGARVAGDVLAMARCAQAEPPRLASYDPWGRRVDRIETCAGWRQLHAFSAESGMVATGYERRESEFSRVHQFARLYLFNPSSAIFTCPLAMTDGAARVLELHGDRRLRQGVLPHLLARDPAQFWTSGQWMTERSGGSDVSGTATEAHLEEGQYRLYGTKWFTSAADSAVALTLARDPESRGLSLFFLETRCARGNWNRIRVLRLKDKLGTRAMATAELELAGTTARMIGAPGQGVRTISTMLNITRAYNAVSAVGFMRRGLVLARDYARRRVAFAKPLSRHDLHLETLATLTVEIHAAFHLVFHLALLLGHQETGAGNGTERTLLRLLTPVVKLFTARQAVEVASEVLECFGGAGYIEDTGLPAMLRDSQVLPIWEGTTNVLSLDLQRALARGDSLEVLEADICARLRAVGTSELVGSCARVDHALMTLTGWWRQRNETDGVAHARHFAMSLARVYAAALMLEFAAAQAACEGGPRYLYAAQRWCERELCSPRLGTSWSARSADLALQG